MAWRNSTDGWGRTARLLHWFTAVLIFTLLAVGFFMTEFLKPSPQTAKIYAMHKSFGLLVLLILLVRLFWRGVDRAPPALPMPAWQLLLARVVHGLLYLVALAMPITGWLMHSASGYPLKLFLFGPSVPPLIERSSEAKHLWEEWHENLAWVLMAILVLHIAGALKHHFIDRDRTLGRMWRGN